MTERRQMSFSSFKKLFDDQLTCSVCSDLYTNPKTLLCHHSFCLKCIEKTPVEKDGKCYISCPTCRVDHLLPQGGANSLPNAFKINRLIDLQKTLAFYCETCRDVICRDCTISTEHKKHIFYLISECYPKHHQQIQDNLDLVKHKLANMNTAMTHLDTRDREVVEQGENVKEQINAHAQQLIDNIQQSRTHLTQQVDTIVLLKTKTLATQRQQAQKLHTQLKTCQDMIEHSLKEWNQQQILAQKIIMMEEMNTATQHVDPAVFQPIEDANIHFSKPKNGMGFITGITYGKATLEVSPCKAKQPSTATLTLYSQDGSPFSLPPSLISSTLSCHPGNKYSVKCPITQTQPGKYNITFTPSARNDHLIVQVGGVDIPDSPFTLPVIPTPEMRGEPAKIMTGMNKPYGIAVCDNGDILVIESGAHCVTIWNIKGKKVKTFEGLKYPRGVAVSIDGHILVTDDHRLQKITTDGVCVKSVGSASESGHGQLQLYSPHGIAVHPTTGQVFVADHSNHRIQVFRNDLTFSHTIFPRSSSLQFSPFCPQDVGIDNEGYLYIVNDRGHPHLGVLKVSGNTGEVIERFSSTPDNEVISASSVTIHNNLVYVSQYFSDVILVCDTDCKFQHLHALPISMSCPLNIALDVFGNLYISDFDRNRVLVI